MNRVFDSSGPEGKVRGTPQQIIEKYNQLARDAQLAGDRVAAENFQQHAEHYLRLLSAAQKEMDAKREVQERENRERQIERDKDRERSNDRARRQERESNGSTADEDLSQAPQPDLIETESNDSGLLVETPESQPAAPKPRRSRKPRAENPVQEPGQSPVQSPVQNEANVASDENGSTGTPDAPDAHKAAE
jgi:hypothetical protein